MPGQAVWKPSVCPLCPSACGLTVRVMDADADVVRNGKAGVVQILAAKKLEGNPNHPINRGGAVRPRAGRDPGHLSPRSHHAAAEAERQSRRRNITRRSRGTPRLPRWSRKLNEIAASGKAGSLAFFGRPGSSHRNALIAEFLSRFGAPAADQLRTVWRRGPSSRESAVTFGVAQLPTFDLAHSRYVLNFGADFLGTWNAPVSHARALRRDAPGPAGVRGHFVQVESRMSQTGRARTNGWRSGRERKALLALGSRTSSCATSCVRAAGRARHARRGWTAGLPDYAPERVEEITGVSAKPHRTAGARVRASVQPALRASSAARALAHTNGLFTAVAVNALNALAGSVGKPGGMSFTPQLDIAAAAKLTGRPRHRAGRCSGCADAPVSGAGHVQALLLDGVNPVFTAPRGWKLRDALAKVPFIVSFGSFLDETSVMADLILPDHSFLESWADAVPESGSAMAVVSARRPVMKPLHQTRATPDVLLEVGRQLEKPIELPWQTFEEMLTATFAALPAMTEGSDAWTDAQEKGGWWGSLPASGPAEAGRYA